MWKRVTSTLKTAPEFETDVGRMRISFIEYRTDDGFNAIARPVDGGYGTKFAITKENAKELIQKAGGIKYTRLERES